MSYNQNDMDQNHQPPSPAVDSPEEQNRRELVTKLGKYAIYAAPFTVMALNSKAATASGPGAHAKPGR